MGIMVAITQQRIVKLDETLEPDLLIIQVWHQHPILNATAYGLPDPLSRTATACTATALNL